MVVVTWVGPLFVPSTSGRARVDSLTQVEPEDDPSDAVVESLGARVGATAELPKGFAFPGFVDAHAHLGRLGMAPDSIRLEGDESLSALRRKLHGPVTPDAWLVGYGWRTLTVDTAPTSHLDPTQHPEPRRVLDELRSDVPIALTRADGHALWVNSLGLRCAGIERQTADPPGGWLGRGRDGEPNGLLVDSAMELVRAHIPPVRDAALDAMVLEEAGCFHRTGVTCVHEMVVDAQLFASLRRLEQGRTLPLRVRAFIYPEPDALAMLPERKVAPSPARLGVRGLKLFADGALGSGGARLSTGGGVQPDSASRFRAVIDKAQREGWQVAVHAIGDVAVRDAVDALQVAPPGARWRVEHVQVAQPSELRRMAALGLCASVQPLHALSDLPWAQRTLAPELLVHAYPWRALRRAGVRFGFGSDHPIETSQAATTLWGATMRQTEAGVQLPGEAQRLDRRDALWALTGGAASLTFDEPWLGQLWPGFRADFSVWDTDLSACTPQSLLTARCLATVVAGRLVWER
ncbi:MAG: hypothetical protein AUK47_18510 [Deltaproteobacteria bacterium CG2_30_63_29]|nr:MAG: hypothetical protein AUK47_18510 [Deltaproteobacteria bacterium CG2_30_63_29]